MIVPWWQRIAAAATALLPVTLVLIGLLATPSFCRCGAPLPHAHALFELPGHTHAADASRAHAHGSSERASASATAVGTGPAESETVRSWPVVPAWGTALALWAATSVLVVAGRLASPWTADTRLCGRRLSPPVPPPRLAFA